MKLSEVPRPPNHILVMGKSGTGKTWLCGTLARMMPTLVVTADPAGLDTLRGMGVDPEVILLTSWADCWTAYTAIAEATKTCQALALDDLGSLQETARHRIERSARTQKETELVVRQALMLGERRLRIQEWGELWIALESFLYEVLKLPYKVKLVTVLEDKATDPRTEEEHLYPALQGGLRSSLLARFSLVGEVFVHNLDGKDYYCLTTRSHPRLETKDRFLPGGRTWTSPTAEKLLLHIAGAGDKETAIEAQIGTGLKIRKEEG